MSRTSAQYSSRMGAVLTMIGVAVGLGNVWRFPYMMGTYGGSAFLLIYLLFTISLAFPALLTEMLVGKQSQSSTLIAYKKLYGKPWGNLFGYLLILAVTIAGSYYVVVVANVFFSAGFSIIQGFSAETNPDYQQLLSNAPLQYGLAILIIALALLVSYKGLKNGIEKISKVIMPFFLLSIVYMIVHAWSLPGALPKVRQFLSPDFSMINSTDVFAALGQAFYSIGLGGTFVVIYASYIAKDKDIPRIAVFTCLGDLGSSLLVSLFLVPTILVMGMQMNAGPTLIFQTFPELFAVLPAGRLIGSLFLLALSLVAFLSLIAAFQVPISSLTGKRFSRKKIILGFGILQLILSFPSAFYPDLIGILDLIFGSGMQVFGSMLAVMGMWWGTKSWFYRKMLFSDPGSRYASMASFWLRWVVPGTLLAVLIGYVYNNL